MEQALKYYHQSLAFWQSLIETHQLSIKQPKIYSSSPFPFLSPFPPRLLPIPNSAWG